MILFDDQEMEGSLPITLDEAEGTAAKINIETAEVVQTLDTGMKAPNRTLAGIAEFKG